MKNYCIKVNDFCKLTSNKNLLSTDQAQALEKYQVLIPAQAVKFLPRGKDVVLIIGQDNKYYVTAKPVYQPTLVKILESVDIPAQDIILVNRPSASGQELTIDQLKNILKK
jgi:hypothetical protein